MVIRRGSTVYASTAAGSRIIVMRQSVPRDGEGQGLGAVFAASSRECGLGPGINSLLLLVPAV